MAMHHNSTVSTYVHSQQSIFPEAIVIRGIFLRDLDLPTVLRTVYSTYGIKLKSVKVGG